MRNFMKSISGLLTFWHPHADKLRSVSLLFARVVVGRVFLLSGLAKWSGFFKFDATSYDLFRYEFFCPEEVRKGALRLCDAALNDYPEDGNTMTFIIDRLANIAGLTEVVFGATLILGLYSRLSALVLLGMTLFIQFFVFPDAATWWGSHAWWFIALFVIVAHGPGRYSLDKLSKVET